jgi:hypothetical protein
MKPGMSFAIVRALPYAYVDAINATAFAALSRPSLLRKKERARDAQDCWTSLALKRAGCTSVTYHVGRY